MLKDLSVLKVKFLFKLFVFSFFLFTFLNVVGSKSFVYATNGASCTGWPNCGGVSTCSSANERCMPPFAGQTMGSCQTDPTCATNPTPCTPVGKCGDGAGGGAFKSNCDIGSMCTSTGGGTCVPDSINCSSCIGFGDECVVSHPDPCCTGSTCKPFVGLPSRCVVNPPPPIPGAGDPPIFTGDTIDIGILFGALASILIPGGIALALIRIAWAGYEFMISEGNPQKVAEAKEDLTAAIIGALFILLSVVIFRVILSSFLGDPGF